MLTVTRIAVAKHQVGVLAGIATARDEDSKDAPDTLWRFTEGDYQRLGEPFGQTSFEVPAVARNADGRLEAVVSGGGVWHAWQLTPASDRWTDWQSLGGPPEPVASQLALVPNRDGRLELFALDFHAAVWHAWQTTPGDDWTGWHSLGTPSDEVSLMSVDPPVVARNEDGRLELFMRGNDETLWHCWQREAGSRPWAAWSPLGSPSDQLKLSGAPMVARNNDGRLEVFAQASDRTIWHRWQQAAGAGPWAAWSPLGTIEKQDIHIDIDEVHLAVGTNADGRLALFAAGVDTTVGGSILQQREQTAPNNGWSEWKPIEQSPPGAVADLRVALDGEGRLQLFMRDLHYGGLYQLTQSFSKTTEWQTGFIWGRPSEQVNAGPAKPTNSA